MKYRIFAIQQHIKKDIPTSEEVLLTFAIAFKCMYIPKNYKTIPTRQIGFYILNFIAMPYLYDIMDDDTIFNIQVNFVKLKYLKQIQRAFIFSDSSDKTKSRAYLLKKKVLPRWDNSRGKKKP